MPQQHIKGRACLTGSERFYTQALTIARESQVPFLVGGAFAFGRYTGIARDTKDLDLFVRERDCGPLLEAFAAQGFHTELTFPHWLAKAFCGDYFVDVIFSSGNGIARVDDEWFEHAVPEELWGLPVQLIPAEEMIWSKGFIMERERYDGADVAHVLYNCGAELEWNRLLRRFGENWRVLLNHLVLFGFIYPHRADQVPAWVMETLIERLRSEIGRPLSAEPVCRGTLLSRQQYLLDVERDGFCDARIEPRGEMTPAEIAHWTAAIDK